MDVLAGPHATALDRWLLAHRREALSGHVVYATALFGVLAWFALTRSRRSASVAFLGVVAAMGPLRIVDGAHWPSDVLAGYALGLAWTIVVLALGLPWATRAHARGVPSS